MEKAIKGTIAEKIEKLAKLKMQAKTLEAEIKERQVDLISVEGVAMDFITPYGKLSFQTRESYDTKDKIGLIKHIGQKAYNAHSTISKTGIKNAIGDLGFQEILDKGFMSVKSVSEYFMLRK